MKELADISLSELHEEARGRILLAIGKGDFSGELYTMLDMAMRAGFARGKGSLTREDANKALRMVVLNASDLLMVLGAAMREQDFRLVTPELAKRLQGSIDRLRTFVDWSEPSK